MMDKVLMLYNAEKAEFIACVVIAALCGFLMAVIMAAMAPTADQGDIEEDLIDDDA